MTKTLDGYIDMGLKDLRACEAGHPTCAFTEAICGGCTCEGGALVHHLPGRVEK